MIRTLAAAFVTTTCIVALATPAAAQTHEFNIPAGSLRSALDAFARQSGRQVIYRGDEVRSARSPGVRGARTAEDALDAILAGTGFTAMKDSSGAFAVAKLGNAPAAAETAASSVEDSADASQEIVVTGTNIRGVSNSSIPVNVYTSRDIQDSGYTTTEQFIESLPQNFRGGDNGASQDGPLGPGANAQRNIESSSSVNLRGLGTTSTLVLVNGHRLAASAYGTAVDISTIPVGAIQRIEVLEDGSSAIYGSDAVAGVVNFILRKDYEGAETRLSYGSVTDGSLQERIASQTFGTRWRTGSVMVSGQIQNRDALPSSERSFTRDAFQPTDLLPDYTKVSLLGSANQAISDTVALSLDGYYANQHNERSTTSALQSNRVRAASDQLGIAAELTAHPISGWEMSLGGQYSLQTTRVTEFFTPATPGYQNGDVFVRNRFTLLSADARAEGPLFTLRASPVRLAVGASYRQEKFASIVPYLMRDRRVDRSVHAIFGELFIPIATEADPLPFARELSLSAAIRYDNYSDFGGTTNPRIGASWSPFSGLRLRANYSTSFRAPNPNELINVGTGATIFTYPFASPSGGTDVVLVASGSNETLAPERAKNLSLGATVELGRNGPRISVDYYDIRFRDRIVIPPFDTSALLRPEVYGSLITNFTNDAEAASFLANEIANGATFFPISGSSTAGIRYAYDFRLQNAASVRQSGFDVNITYQGQVGGVTLRPRVSAAIINKIDTGFTAISSPTDVSDTYGNPLRFRLRASLGAEVSNIRMALAVNHSGGYRDTSASPPIPVDSWTTIDANAEIRPSWLRGASLTLSIVNLANARPPFVMGSGVQGIHYDIGNANPLGRFISTTFGYKW